MLKVTKEKEHDIIPLAISPDDNFRVYNFPFISISGKHEVPGAIYIDNRNTKVYNEFETPEFLEPMQLMG